MALGISVAFQDGCPRNLRAYHIRMNLIHKELKSMPNKPGSAGALDAPIVEKKERTESLDFYKQP